MQDLGATDSTRWFGSERVRPQTTRIEQVLEQASQMQSQTGDAARWLGECTDVQGEATKKGIRRAEDLAAVGGLRSPHKSVRQISKAPVFGKWLEDRLCSVLREDDTEALAATRTLGSEVTPQVLVERAREVRTALCTELQIQPGPETALQGQLIAGLAAKMEDPDAPVKEWLRRGTVPLGIRAPIEAGGVFPKADPAYPDVDTDLNFWLDNYATFTEHQAGAEEIWRKRKLLGGSSGARTAKPWKTSTVL